MARKPPLDIVEVHVTRWLEMNPPMKRKGVKRDWMRIDSALIRNTSFLSLPASTFKFFFTLLDVCAEQDAATVLIYPPLVAASAGIKSSNAYAMLEQLAVVGYIKCARRSTKATAKLPLQDTEIIDAAAPVDRTGQDKTRQDIATPPEPEKPKPQIPSNFIHPAMKFDQRFKTEHPDSEKFEAWLKTAGFADPELRQNSAKIMVEFQGFETFMRYFSETITQGQKFKSIESVPEQRNYATMLILIKAGLKKPAERKPQ